jgi:hypothetical protein
LLLLYVTRYEFCSNAVTPRVYLTDIMLEMSLFGKCHSLYHTRRPYWQDVPNRQHMA